jgi:hypothetical protein
LHAYILSSAYPTLYHTVSAITSPQADPSSGLNRDAFDRLRWSILDPTHSIQVADDNNDSPSAFTPYSDTHSVALQPATTIGASQMLFTVDSLGMYESQWNDGISDPEDGVEHLEDSWDYIMIRSKDGKPLLVRDVVAQLHEWFNSEFIADRIRESLAWMYNSITTILPDGRGCTEIPTDGVDEVPEDVRILVEDIEDDGCDDDDTGASKACIRLEVEGFE